MGFSVKTNYTKPHLSVTHTPAPLANPVARITKKNTTNNQVNAKNE